MRAENGHFIEGNRIYLREVQVADVAAGYYRWFSDPEVNRFLESRYIPHSEEMLADYVRSCHGSRTDIFLAIIDKETNRHIGNIKLGGISWIHRTADIGLLIGEKDFWGRGYGTEAITLVTAYAFDRLNLRKVWAGAYGSNWGSVKAFEKAGFEIECVRKAHYFCNGAYEDDVILTKFRENAALGGRF